MPEVDRVRKETSYVPSQHEHIEGVCSGGTHYTRLQVVAGIRRGENWYTRGTDGSTARMKEMPSCPRSGCPATPYITTAPDHTAANNLENLPRC